ncbi:hypothetical protein [Andreprevotia lacus]|jgi:TPR repeat protein|uniref:hypothetical protein n=1 Tax=Andreprevotia lacus TaxID=1121000 RepID=UPI00111C8BB5|nr:hypothetical protein [Andreprevotia lacus]
MTKAKRDLIIHFDEENETIVCYSTEERNIEKIRAREFPLEVPLSMYVEAGADDAERMMGAGIFALLELHGGLKLGMRDYKGESREAKVADFAKIEFKAQHGDAECQFMLAMDLFSRGVRTRSASDIELAEVWLEKSAEGNFLEAIEYLHGDWAMDKDSALRGISGD